MSGFDANWLQLREPFDDAARDSGLGRRFGNALGNNALRRIVDLAAGSGANFRALAPLIGGDQDWLLVDNNPALIAAQAAQIRQWAQRRDWQCHEVDDRIVVETASAHWRVRAQTLDLANGLEEIDFAACDGVTTAAFLDLVSAAWLDRLCDVLVPSDKPLLAVLTVDGRRAWQPALPADAQINAAFQRHQRSDKGFGPAAGNLATSDLAERLMAQGFAVSSAHSDWRIAAEHRAMLLHLVDEAAAVAHAVNASTSAPIAQWTAQRHAQIDAGVLTLAIGHLDLLAIPASHPSA